MVENMNKREKRHEKILNLLLSNDLVTIGEFCEALNCSEATIRNDLRYLEENGLVKRNFGGAVATGNTSFNSNFSLRASVFREEKQAIAGYVVEHIITPGQTIALDAGSTCTELAQKIIESMIEVTVLTNSLSSALILAKSSKVRLYLTGGFYDFTTYSFHDEIARSMLESLRADVFFMSPNGVSVDDGLTTPGPEEAILKQLLIRCSGKCIALADHSKLGKVGFKVVCGLDRVAMLITDSAADQLELAKLHQAGVDVVAAPMLPCS